MVADGNRNRKAKRRDKYRMTERPQLPPKPLGRLVMAGIFTAVGVVATYEGLVFVVVILASGMVDGDPDFFGAAVYAMGAAALVAIFASTVWALATAPGDKPLSTVRRVIFTLGTLSSVGFFYFEVQTWA
jgi:uncharacterized membrane protein